MEEILASIRKIIAEDPADPRITAAPRAVTPAKPSLDRSLFLRDAHPIASDIVDRGTEPVDTAHGQDVLPERASTIGDVADAASTNGAAHHAATQISTPDDEPSMGDAEGASTTEATPAVDNSPSASIDAQLSDLLDDDAGSHTEDRAQTNIVAATTAETASDSDSDSDGDTDTDIHASAAPAAATANSTLVNDSERASDTSSAATDGAIDAEFSEVIPARSGQPRFTVSRDGYVPDASSVDAHAANNRTLDAAAPATSWSNSSADPVSDRNDFEFNLGPSPFTTSPKASGAPNAQSPIASVAHARPSYEPQAAPTMPSQQRPSSAPFKMTNGSFANVNMSPPVEAPRRRDVLETPTPQITASIAAPSVEATLPPRSTPSVASTFKPRYASDTAETIARVTQAVTDEATAAASTGFVAVQVLENPVMLDVIQAPQKVHPVSVRGFDGPQSQSPMSSPINGSAHGPSSSLTVTVEPPQPAVRTMEDTVADLLRPMLKSWLAENMPKIVERALRREISDLEGPSQSRAAE